MRTRAKLLVVSPTLIRYTISLYFKKAHLSWLDLSVRSASSTLFPGSLMEICVISSKSNNAYWVTNTAFDNVWYKDRSKYYLRRGYEKEVCVS